MIDNSSHWILKLYLCIAMAFTGQAVVAQSFLPVENNVTFDQVLALPSEELLCESGGADSPSWIGTEY